MTNHTEISRKLALAIGWKQVITSGLTDNCYVKFGLEKEWREFDYRAADVAWGVAKRYGFPHRPMFSERGDWYAAYKGMNYYEETPELAVAMAVIGGAG